MYTIDFLPEVYDDIAIAYSWYEEQKIGLGEKFISELENAYTTIGQSPKVYQILYKNTRRKLIKHFPYGVFFRLIEGQIIIVAIIHTKRNPLYFQERL